MLYGDFGPSTTVSKPGESEAGAKELQSTTVAEDDFARAFWVSTKQNGITQTWAPRWTMFSRGNIKEKARLLNFHSHSSDTTSQNQLSHRYRYIFAENRRSAMAVDLYAGIGYFAFCYAALGFRVLCWELNPWSVEGLRRGAQANGWSVRVVIPSPHEQDSSKMGDWMLKDVLAGNDTIVVFLEDNTRAAGRIRRLSELTREREEEQRDKKEVEEDKKKAGLSMGSIMHVNLGLLPSSEGSWETAWDVASETPQAWFHIHENVGAPDIDARKGEIEQWFADRAQKRDEETEVCVEHVELVKTFAPGVWHCVFDLSLRRGRGGTGSIT
jgi:tRNA wybutosine-synthesizing protein 2